MSFWGYVRGNNLSSQHLVDVVESRVRELLQPYVGSIEVDEEYYLQHNPDVLQQLQSGRVKSAREHYMISGYFEDRFPRPIVVDEPWYLKEYGDVSDAVSRGVFASAKQHFEREGFREGRLPSDSWTLIGHPKA